MLAVINVVVEGDEGSRLRMDNKPAVLPGYRPLLTSQNMMSHFSSLLNTTVAVICVNNVICLLLSLDAIETGVHLQ